MDLQYDSAYVNLEGSPDFGKSTITKILSLSYFIKELLIFKCTSVCPVDSSLIISTPWHCFVSITQC